MTCTERYKRWHDITDAIILAVNSVTVLHTALGNDTINDIDDRCACEFVLDKIISAFTMSKIQYKKYKDVAQALDYPESSITNKAKKQEEQS